MDKPVSLATLRAERGVTQASVAAHLGVSQPRVSVLESGREDQRVATLRRYVEALGGRLELTVVFDDGTVQIGV